MEVLCLMNPMWTLLSRPKCEPKEGPGVPAESVYHPALKSSSHVSLDVNSPTPGNVPLSVLDGFTGKQVPLILKKTDTVQRLKQMLKEHLKMPSLGDDFPLILNGTPVTALQTMAELQVKPGAVFMTYRRCMGG